MKETVELLFEQSEVTLGAAAWLLEGDYPEDSVSRSYYAIFYAAQAALLTEDVTPKTHAGTRAMFGKHFVKTGRIPPEVGRLLGQVFDTRRSSDYRHAPTATTGEARRTLRKAETFVEHVEHYLRERS